MDLSTLWLPQSGKIQIWAHGIHGIQGIHGTPGPSMGTDRRAGGKADGRAAVDADVNFASPPRTVPLIKLPPLHGIHLLHNLIVHCIEAAI